MAHCSRPILAWMQLFLMTWLATAAPARPTPEELHARAVAATKARQANLQKVEKFLLNDGAQKILQAARVDPKKIQQALPLLSDQELARLAERAGKAEGDLAAGALSNQEITYILIALATAVVVLLIVQD